MSHPTVYRETPLKVILRDNGTVRYVSTDYPERDVTSLLTDEMKDELAAQVRCEIEEETR
jgi:hypothetical protein